METKIFRMFMLMMTVGAAWCLVSCVSNSEDEPFPANKGEEVAVSFSPNVGDSQGTRASYADSKGEISTTEDLQKVGFGVFSYYSEADEYQYDSDKSGEKPFNFMYNQKVTHAGGTNWTYSPLKYWPNDNEQADNSGAVGSKHRSYLSFFAYAPYTENTVSETTTQTETKEEGSIAVTGNTVNTGKSYINYRMSDNSPCIFSDNVDLLWAARPNLWKTMEDEDKEHPGYVNGQVKFNFKHALSKFTITVQGLFDHVDNDDTSPDYPDEVDENTRILVESVDFGGSPIMKEGKMYIVPQPDNNGALPKWEIKKEYIIPLDIKDNDINSDISNTYPSLDGPKKYSEHYFPKNTEETTVDATETKALFDELPTGVTHSEVSLFNQKESETPVYYIVIPNKDYIDKKENKASMQVHIVYHVITYDQNLKLNTPPYCSIVKNDITATFANTFVFEPNKQYKLRLLLGLTTMKFQLEVAEGWDAPLVMDPVVIDWNIEKMEYDIK